MILLVSVGASCAPCTTTIREISSCVYRKSDSAILVTVGGGILSPTLLARADEVIE
jgi:hypothetical protein